jgi:hypothetical protein
MLGLYQRARCSPFSSGWAWWGGIGCLFDGRGVPVPLCRLSSPVDPIKEAGKRPDAERREEVLLNDS